MTERQDRPLYATGRNRKRGTYADRIEAHHLAMTGSRFMPWQRDVAEVSYEHDRNGLLHYRFVVVKVPRQSGKTSLGDAVLVGRCATWPRQACLLMAQDRNMSRARLLDEIWNRRLRGNPHYPQAKARRLTGWETIQFNEGDASLESWIGISAVTPDAGHGLTLDTAFIDEVWTHNDFRALQALSPTMVTRPDPQTWLVTTEGTDESVVLDHWTKLGRDTCGDTDGPVAYFEWAKPDGVDVYDESQWPSYMPAVGHTQTVEAIRAEAATLPEGEFLRAFGNVRTRVVDAVFPPGTWEACGNPSHAPTGPLYAALDVPPDRARACIVVCGGGCVEVVEDRPGTGWVVDRMLELESHGILAVAIDNVGPVVSLASELEYRGMRVERAGVSDLKAACGRFYDAVVAGELRHRGQQALDEAAASARRRQLLDAWAWSRKGHAYISPLVAATLAYWAWAEQPEQELAIY